LNLGSFEARKRTYRWRLEARKAKQLSAQAAEMPGQPARGGRVPAATTRPAW
jgi:hypothetical protein